MAGATAAYACIGRARFRPAGSVRRLRAGHETGDAYRPRDASTPASKSLFGPRFRWSGNSGSGARPS